MSKKAREKPAEAGSASVSPYGSVLGYELVTSQPNRLINLIWPECRTWFIGPWACADTQRCEAVAFVYIGAGIEISAPDMSNFSPFLCFFSFH